MKWKLSGITKFSKRHQRRMEERSFGLHMFQESSNARSISRAGSAVLLLFSVASETHDVSVLRRGKTASAVGAPCGPLECLLLTVLWIHVKITPQKNGEN